jgi:hypothetical protein
MSSLGEQGENPQRLSAAQLAEAVKRLRKSAAYADAKAKAAEVLSKHELSSVRSQHITEDDLSVRINER